ncbi:MAG TPA: protein-disulfide reductase DsbD domain-containing protein [Hyphomicrobium sp.]|nr:protein-disulfide reductase DsbD domain-containing protein [Hyphomicrobium sp.]
MRKSRTMLTGALALFAACAAATAAVAEVTSDWVSGHSSRARLVGGGGILGVELELPQGWKTYWRYPGEAGGVAPSFDWSKSQNLESAEVLYPAPRRMSDSGGETIGYKGSITFPVRLKAKDPTKPIDVHLALDYGVCKEICIPAQAELSLAVPPDTAISEDLMDAIARVPAGPQARRESDPLIKKAAAELGGDKPRIVIDAEVPEGSGAVDAFVDAPDGIYVPLPTKVSGDGKGPVTFQVDLSKDVDLSMLKGKQLTATVVSDKGQSEVTFPLE